MAKSVTTPINATRTRPNMPHYGIATAEEGMMTWEWVDEQMAKSRNYWICTTRPDGRPHVSPVWGVWVGGKLYFGSHITAVKSKNVTKNPNVVVHLESGDDTVIFEGTLDKVSPDSAEFKALDDAFFEKHPPFRPSDGLGDDSQFYVLKPKVVFAWREESYPTTATRWDFKND
jgi:nitroimidazol reductase NimA-like FMN-containing flavoprotein (pyridoxamine 5'-phosphate oxidase superfamily)